MIHDLKREGLSLSAIARQTGLDRKTVRKYLDTGLKEPRYTPRDPRPRLIDPYARYLQDRVAQYPDLSGKRLLREIRDLGYEGGYTAVKEVLRDARPPKRPAFERRFETPPGQQAQVDFAEFVVEFTAEPGVVRKVRQQALLARRPTNVVLVAMANKTARVVWVLLSRKEDYKPEALTAA